MLFLYSTKPENVKTDYTLAGICQSTELATLAAICQSTALATLAAICRSTELATLISCYNNVKVRNWLY